MLVGSADPTSASTGTSGEETASRRGSTVATLVVLVLLGLGAYAAWRITTSPVEHRPASAAEANPMPSVPQEAPPSAGSQTSSVITPPDLAETEPPSSTAFSSSQELPAETPIEPEEDKVEPFGEAQVWQTNVPNAEAMVRSGAAGLQVEFTSATYGKYVVELAPVDEGRFEGVASVEGCRVLSRWAVTQASDGQLVGNFERVDCRRDRVVGKIGIVLTRPQ